MHSLNGKYSDITKVITPVQGRKLHSLHPSEVKQAQTKWGRVEACDRRPVD